ncbi:MAG: sugar-binding transcriptional regulator [Cellulosilyticaceae bacterium]
MENIILSLEKIIPEGIESFKSRYALLQLVRDEEPIGRRALASILNLSERLVRSELELLTRQGLLEASHLGVSITQEGKMLLSNLYFAVENLDTMEELEEEIMKILPIKRVIIVRGDVDLEEATRDNLGKAGANLLTSLLHSQMIIALTGGTTLSKMIEHIPNLDYTDKNLTIMPARGSIGEKVEYEANTLVVNLAKKLHAKYELLNIPDNLGEDSIESIKREPHIQKRLQKIPKSDIIIFGLGDAFKMAKRRREPMAVMELLSKKQAIGEAFRYYFDKNGQIIYAPKTLGVDLEIAKKIPIRIAVAGGKTKAKAILAATELLRDSYLILDEGAAVEIIENSKSKLINQ